MRLYLLISIMIFQFEAFCESDWKVDFSRRVKSAPVRELNESPTEVPPEGGFLSGLFDSSEPIQEMVILNTEKGFVPSIIRVKQNGNYRIHLVNVNEKDKNISFVLDAFSENHSTFFGKIKSFEIRPKRNGVFKFVCPETAIQGQLVVYPTPGQDQKNGPELRQPASESP
jgi:hypothetical protein